MADCKAFRKELDESIGKEGLSLEARAHAGACPSCGEFGREHAALRRLVGGLVRVEAPADFDARLRARMRTESRGGGRYSFFGQRLAPALAWTAAVSFLVVSASLYVWQKQSSFESSQQAKRVGEPLYQSAEVVVDKSVTDKNPALKVDAQKKLTRSAEPTDEVAHFKLSESPRGISPRRLLREASRKEPKSSFSSVSSSDFSVTGARVLHLKIPLSTTSETLRLVVRDERGNTRPVPMRAVSFGSQELVAGASVGARLPANDKGGVW